MADFQRAGIARRKFVNLATAAFATAGAGAALWPLIDQMNPPWHTRPDSIEVDVSSIAEGQTSTIRWSGQPVYIRHRTQNDIAAARRVPLSELRDQDARLIGAAKPRPATDENRSKPGHAEWIVVVGLCPHDNCMLQGNDPGFRGDYGGWWCPICSAHFDTSGRTRSGPAQKNLPIPPYRFLTPAKIALVPEIMARVGQID